MIANAATIVEAVDHLKVLSSWFEVKRDLFDSREYDHLEINGKRIIDMNHDMWTGFIDELTPALALLLEFLEEQGVCYPIQEDTV